ncbi:MAG: sugar ABC transporter permease, partial [Cypionkella sp.]|nr:sugar ABC transporter permease [Cypionkella sp.]
LVTALVLNRKIIGRGFWRGVFFYPVLLSPVVVALIWKWLLQSQGVFNAALVAVGSEPIDWLTTASWAFFWTVFVSIWAHMGFYTLILLAGLQAIPKDLYEAAEMDGASVLSRFFYLTVPHLTRAVTVVILIQTIFLLAVFAEIYVTTAGGPGTATTTISYLVYMQSLVKYDVGAGSAGGIIAVILANIVAFFAMRMIGKNLDA